MDARKRFAVLSMTVALAVPVGVTGALGAEHEGTEATVYMAAVEPRGSTNVANEPFPEVPLPEGGGYVLREPDAEGNWSVSVYMWMPEQVVVTEGDEVTLRIVGINGAAHPSIIEGYDIEFDVARGALTDVTFTADRVGTFPIICVIHQPTMTGQLIVLPRG
jgi:plastocyanin